MTARHPLLVPALLLIALLAGAAGPPTTHARAQVFVGIGPIVPYGYAYPYGYPYAYYPPPYPYPVPAPWVAAPSVPPAGWDPGHWERHYDAGGRPYDVWVPPHLR